MLRTELDLETNLFATRNVVLPLAAAVAILAAGVSVALLFGKENKDLFDVSMGAGLGGALLGFLVVRLLVSTKKVLLVGPTEVAVVKKNGGRVLARSALDRAEVDHGYFPSGSRFASGYVPVICLRIPGHPPLRITAKDFANHYVWEGDDHEAQSFSRPTNLPEANTYVTGGQFMFLARLVVKGDRLIQKPNR